MNTDTVNKRVELIKSHDDDINLFINEYKPFIASCVTKITGRFVRYGEDDELSIALIAFTEAIKAFDSYKGNFLPFANNVIKRRLIDYYRKEKKHERVIYLNDCQDEEDNEEADLTADLSKQQHSDKQESEYRRLEIMELSSELEGWGISFNELIAVSPKHDKTRKACLDIIKCILTSKDLINNIRNKKYLPVAEIEKISRVSRKTIERARKYIITMVLIMTGDYLYLQEYIDLGN